MLNKQKYIDRLEELINQGEEIKKSNELKSKWVINIKNIINSIFGVNSGQIQDLNRLFNGFFIINKDKQEEKIDNIIGYLKGTLEDIKEGYIEGIDLEIKREVFLDILEDAKYIIKKGNKDIAAVEGRIVLEGKLKSMGDKVGINTQRVKADTLNSELKKANVYDEPQRSQIQTWLAIGNSAAHGNFHEYTKEEVENMLKWIDNFIKQ